MGRYFHHLWLPVAILFLAGEANAVSLISNTASWRFFKGTREVSSPISAWRARAFDDSTWQQGPAPFHYGAGIAGGTMLSDMRNNYSCVFLRRSFHVTDTAQAGALRLRTRCDDGFIAWINGVEVARYNVPDGERAFNTFASGAVSEPVIWREFHLPPPNYLVADRNVLAVQVFNTSRTSSDLQFEAELFGEAPDNEAPRVLAIEPPPGAIEAPIQFIITFSESVAGVSASDLFLGPQPAASVSGNGAVYTFTFDSVATGSWELRWDADAVITDLATPANRFDPLAAGTSLYEAVDRTPPILADVTPRPETTLRTLSSVELRFSEPVTGLDASDLLANGIPARSITGAMAGPYRFEFPEPGKGRVHFTWAANHEIRDLASPANWFSTAEWSIVIDPEYSVPPLRINEFLASNVGSTGLKDEDGALQDWIEIFNDGTTAVNLAGWSLTDDRDDRRRWVFPSVTLDPGKFLVVFASGKDRRSPGAKLHTNFKLGPEGEYLGLFNPEPIAVTEFDRYPEQRNDHSYGYNPAQQLRYFRAPTPGAANTASSITGVVPPPHVDVQRGWFAEPFSVTVTSALPGVTFRYTTDGSEPTESNGLTYSAPLRITTTTTLRVVGFNAGMLPSIVVTHTYLSADDVLRQPNDPPGFPVGPTVMAGFPSDYEMDPELVNDPLYRGVMKDALFSLPVLSIVLKTDDMFGAANGIYTHPKSRGPQWERPCSVEFIPMDGATGFQVNAGIQIQGNAAREPHKQPKHPFRLVFKADYGPRALEYRMFPDSPISRFDTLVLRADFNYSWLHWNPVQRIRAQRTRDAWMKDSMRAMGGLASHNRYVHLFINGLYWGIYDPSERPDGSFGAAYLGGEKEDYDVINEGAVVDGSSSAYNAMLAITDVSTPSAYAGIQKYLDLTQFIDYMLLHFYAGHTDWGRNKNWYTLRPKDGRRGFLYVPWDGEMILDETSYNRVANSDTPSDLHTRLKANSEYRLAFADRAHKHLFNNGALTPSPVAERWLNRARQVQTAIVAESGRWGDYRRDVHPYQTGPYQLYTRDNQWRTEQQRLLTDYFPRRTSILLAQLRSAGLYPNVSAPEFSQFGGVVPPGYKMTMSTSSGTIYYTLDGSDPRVAVSGAIAANAIQYDGSVALSNSVQIKARTLRQGVWSALVEAEFNTAASRPPLRITEIMYNPPGGDSFEFLELQNTGALAIDIGGFAFRGIEFVFPHGTVLAPGQIALLASEISPSEFQSRYPNTSVTGYFNGALSNGGERVELRDREGRPITAVVYDDTGAWPAVADGGGHSLELVDPDADPNDPANWLPSSTPDGTPGRPSIHSARSEIRLNEILARGDNPNESDWIEIINSSSSPADLSGWSLTDYSNNPPFVFPAGTLLQAGALLVVMCDGLTNAPGFHAAFRVSRQGETISIHDGSGRRIDALTFGLLPTGFSLARLADTDRWSLGVPTLGAANRPAEMASPTQLKLNEWLADSRPSEDDWVELYNADLDRPVDLKGLLLATDTTVFQMQSLAFVPAGGFIQLMADEKGGPHHLGFKLPASEGSIALLNANGEPIDRVTYGVQTEGISMGRLTDGGIEIGVLTNGPTPARSNTSIERDSDNDGMPDDWETAHGTNPSQADADADPDNDGMTNHQEYLAGTAPKDPASNLRLHAVISDSGSVLLQFLAVSNRAYRIELKPSVSAEWTKLTDVNAQPATRLETIIDTAPIVATRFYRIVALNVEP